MIGRTEPNSTKVKVLAVLKGAKPFAEFKAELDRLLEEAAKPQADAAPPASLNAPRRGPEPAPAAAIVAPAPSRVGASRMGSWTRRRGPRLERVLGTAPAGSPVWIAAPQSDPRALALRAGASGRIHESGLARATREALRRAGQARRPTSSPPRTSRRPTSRTVAPGPRRGGLRAHRRERLPPVLRGDET